MAKGRPPAPHAGQPSSSLGVATLEPYAKGMRPGFHPGEGSSILPGSTVPVWRNWRRSAFVKRGLGVRDLSPAPVLL